MFSRKKKPDPKKKPRRSGGSGITLNNFGLIPSQEVDDDELEAELRALTGGASATASTVSISTNDSDSDLEAELLQIVGKQKSKRPVVKPEQRLQRELPLGSVSKELTDIKSDEDEVDIDENDPELLSELMELTQPEPSVVMEPDDESDDVSLEKEEPSVLTVLKERFEMYKTAETKAKEKNESSRARRFARGIKTLKELIQKAESGQPVLPSEIPPLIATNLKPPSPVHSLVEQTDQTEGQLNISTQTRPMPSDSVSNDSQPEQLVKTLLLPEEPGKGEALPEDSIKAQSLPEIPIKIKASPEELVITSPSSTNGKNSNVLNKNDSKAELKPTICLEDDVSNLTKKFNNCRILDQLADDSANELAHSGQENDVLIKLLKSRRDEYRSNAVKAKKNNQLPVALDYVKKVKQLDAMIASVEKGEVIDENSIPSPVDEPKVPEVPIPLEIPTTVIDALQQRLRIYTEMLNKAERDGNKVLSRQNSKIVQLYRDAIRLHMMGKKVPLERLPTPPGCPPIPVFFQL